MFFLSDNGGPTRELTSSNLPLRGSKGQMYEGGLRVPFMMQWHKEQGFPAGQTYEKPVSSFDIYATAAANSEGVIAPELVEGVDLVPFVTGKKKGIPHETLFWRQGGKCGLRHGDWKIVRMGGRRSPGKSQWELYNLSEDLSEETNLAQSKPEHFARTRPTRLVERWEKMNSEMAEPLF